MARLSLEVRTVTEPLPANLNCMAAGMPPSTSLEVVPDAPAGRLLSFWLATNPHGQAAFNTLLPDSHHLRVIIQIMQAPGTMMSVSPAI